jgi:alkaline phosphatase D
MQVECSTTESFAAIIRSSSVDALPDRDFTANLLLQGLPPGQEGFYRVRFDDIAEVGISGETQIGHFRTAPDDLRSISFVWSGDTAGQGWGIDPSRGGMRPTERCSTTARTSSFTPATASMPIARFHPD